MTPDYDSGFIRHFREMQDRVHQTARDKGWWDEQYRNGAPCNDGEKIALMHSELSEMLEGLRHGDPLDEKCPGFTNAEVEGADLLIRLMDWAEFKGFRIAEAAVAKNAYNQTRPHKHGKKF